MEALRAAHPAFDWQLPLVARELLRGSRQEPVELLDIGAAELSLRHWDFALVITGAELQGHYGGSPSGVPSRAIGVGVLSTFHIDPHARRTAEEDERTDMMRRRLFALAMHVLGHWLGLDHSQDPSDFMTPCAEVEELERRVRFGPGSAPLLERELERVADARVEEEGVARGRVRVYWSSVWRNRASILRTLVHSRAWELPIRLGRLTTAAASALVVMLLTAEGWEVGTRQDAALLALLSVAGIFGTSAFVLKRQRLLPAQRRSGLTEQGAVAHASLVLVVLTGMLVTYALLFLASLTLGRTLISADLLGRWAGIDPDLVGWPRYLRMAAFTSGFGIVIGALGASFEGQHYVRHIAYVDEEL